MEEGDPRTVGQAPPEGAQKESPLQRALEVLHSLDSEGKGFSLRRAEEALAARGMAGSNVVAALLRRGLIYESHRGIYRLV